MIIYAEYLFIENGIAGLIILTLTGRICGFKMSKKQLFLGSVFCGLYSFILFYESINVFLAAFLKAAFSFAVIALSFGKKDKSTMLKTVLIFYLVSLTMGGITIAILYFSNSIGIVQGGIFYIGKISYSKVFLGMIITLLSLYLFSLLIDERLKKSMVEATLKIKVGKQTIILSGFIDTGNFLRDPISGRPVCIAARKTVESLEPKDVQFCAIPYRSIDNKENILSGVRIDDALLMIGEKMKIVNIVLAISETERPIGRNGKRYDVILHEGLSEGGLL
jgi:stage II sporulation protein GA (sporulation sigma-E factor processing peptidase)